MTRNTTVQYALYGAVFGFLFPIFSTLMDVLIQGLPLSMTNIIRVQLANPLHWVIDTAPFFLGLFASFAGRRQQEINQINIRLNEQIAESHQMVVKLEALQVGLERQVRTRTEDLARRKNQLEIAAKVARDAAGIRDLDQLLEQSVHLISNRFGFYHTGIFLVDKSGEYAILQASSSEGGQQMLARNHKLRVGKEGIVGHVAGTLEPLIALDVGTEAVYFDNPELPATHSEMAVPLMARGQLIGVLDVQSIESGAFSEEDVEVLQILADQIALGIETANLIAENKSALEAIDRSYKKLTQQTWERTVKNKPLLGYRCDQHGKVQLSERAWSPSDEETSLQPGIPLRIDERIMAIPISIRGQVVGVVHLKKNEQAGPWTDEETSLMGSITEQMSVALDSAQLYMDSQRRAQRERTVSDITTRIRATNDPQQILQTAVKELQNILHAKRVKFKLSRAELASEVPLIENHPSHDRLTTSELG